MWPFSKRKQATASVRSAPVPRQVAPEPAAARLVPVCASCGTPLERRTPPPNSMLQPLYVGVICRMCGWIECRRCKGSPSDAPCPVCASPVMPAYCALFEHSA